MKASDAMELLPIIDPEELRVVGFAERVWAGTHGLCHLHTVLVPVRVGDGRVAVQTRPEGRAMAGHRDLFGGHVAFGGRFLRLLLGEPFDLEDICRSAAGREAREELLLAGPGGEPRLVTKDDLVQVGPTASLAFDSGRGNVERSTLYLAPVPRDHRLSKIDLVEGRQVAVEIEWVEFDDLLAAFRGRRWNFDGGAQRVLARADADGAFRAELQDRVAELAAS